MKITHRVEKLTNDKWVIIPFTGANLDWCEGYAWAFDDLYPSPSVRVVRIKDSKVLLEKGGNSKPTGMRIN